MKIPAPADTDRYLTTPRQPWDQLDNEPALWFARFTLFRMMPAAKRSINAAMNEEKARLGLTDGKKKIDWGWNEKAKEFDWINRAAAWDQLQIRLEEAEWAERRHKLRDREWDLAEKLMIRAEEMLKFANITRTRYEDNGHIIIIEPVDWRMSDIPKVLQTASDLARLAANMSKKDDDVSSMSDDELKAAILAEARELGLSTPDGR